MTQTSGGSVVQQFGYDAHDKLTSGTAGNETDGYDLNGNETVVTFNGATFHDAYDDEDRLVSVAIPGGPTDTYAYNGLGLRVGKQDSTGSYSFLCDGASPGSPVLSDGHAFYTPGLSENRGGAVSYPAFDRLGNLWTQDASGQSQLYYQDTSGFGTPSFSGGGTASPFRFSGGNGCQSDADTGLVLMGHRYYDTRTGRFITQDPAGAGRNWYAYANNDPVNGVDPSGLSPDPNPNQWSLNGGSQLDNYNVLATTAENAGISVQVAQSAGLIARFKYYSLDKLTTDSSTGLLLKVEHLFYFAVPIGTSLMGNFHAARAYSGPHYMSLFGININMGHPTPIDSFLYVRNHFANATVGDFKDKQFPGLGAPRPGTRLWELADNGGNMNGGMGMQALGLSSDDISISGAIHRSWMAGKPMPDDVQGAAVLQVGYNYALRMP